MSADPITLITNFPTRHLDDGLEVGEAAEVGPLEFARVWAQRRHQQLQRVQLRDYARLHLGVLRQQVPGAGWGRGASGV